MDDRRPALQASPGRMLLPAFAVFLFPLSSLLAQRGDEETTLHIPPKLKVEIANGMAILENFIYPYGRSEAEGEHQIPTSPEFTIEVDGDEQSTALLPMLFFDPGSSSLPERYQLFTRSIDADDYREGDAIITEELDKLNRALPKYYQVLNIIGYRMRNHPQTTVTLEGGYSTEPGETAGIARERAEVVREYLQNIWHISPARIGLLPSRLMTDSSDNILKQEEGRRVTIHTDHWELVRPVVYRQTTLKFSFVGLLIHLDPWIAQDDIADIKLMISSGDRLLSVTTLPTDPDSSTYTYIGLWFLPRRLRDVESGLVTEVLIQTRQGKLRRSNSVSIPVRIEEEEEIFDYGFGDDEREFDGPVLFFESGDTTLSPLQRMTLAKRLEGVRREMKNYTTENWTLRINVGGEMSDNPVIDPAMLQTARFTHGNQKDYLLSLFKDPSFQVPVYIIPMSPESLEERRRSGRLEEEISRTWLGEHVDEIEQVNAERMEDRTPSDNERERITRFLRSRASSVETWLHDRVDTARVFLQNGVTGWEHLPFLLLPEMRFYERSVSIRTLPRIENTETEAPVDFEDIPFEEEGGDGIPEEMPEASPE